MRVRRSGRILCRRCIGSSEVNDLVGLLCFKSLDGVTACLFVESSKLTGSIVGYVPGHRGHG